MPIVKDNDLTLLENEDNDIDELEKEEDVQSFQGSVFEALLTAANYESDTSEQYTIRIKRQVKGQEVILLTFKIHPLSEEKINAIRKKNTKTKRDRRYGIDRDTVDTVRLRSQLIYEATIEADRDAIWNNRKAWEQLNVLNGIDLIDKVLMAGEKDKLVESIENISGYGNDDNMDMIVKN